MTVKTSVLTPINNARAIIAQLGFRPFALTIITRVWTGIRIGQGATVDTRLEITPAPRVRVVSLREVASNVGTLREGDWRVDKITPFDGVSVGWTEAQLRPKATDNKTEILYELAGPEGALLHTLVRADFDRNLGYALYLRRTRRTP